MKRIITITVLLCLQVAAFAQITPSVYVGAGLFTNLGGVLGVGTEFRYKNFSVNAAIGGSDFLDYKDEIVGDVPILGFDVGVKYYFYKGLFGGVNYGLLGRDYSTNHYVVKIENIYDFSFIVGYKLPFNKRFYGMAYIGSTLNEDFNWHFNLFVPHFGLIIGYNLTSNK